jgi:hypothetical protein
MPGQKFSFMGHQPDVDPLAIIPEKKILIFAEIPFIHGAMQTIVTIATGNSITLLFRISTILRHSTFHLRKADGFGAARRPENCCTKTVDNRG